MNGPRGTILLAVLLVISGYLGVIARSLTGTPLFGLMGLAGFLFAAALVLGEVLARFRSGLAEPRVKERKPKPDGEYRETRDGGPVPTFLDPPKRSIREDYYRGP